MTSGSITAEPAPAAAAPPPEDVGGQPGLRRYLTGGLFLLPALVMLSI